MQLPEQDSKDITEMVRSGAYYREAMKWYHDLYHAPNVQRAWLIVITVLASLSALLGFSSLISLLPITDETPLYLLSDDVDAEYTTIKPLQDNALHMNDTLVRYFIKTYVEGRESYQVQVLEAQKSMVRSLSSDAEFARYLQYISQQNPQSPVNQLGLYGERSATVLSMQLHYPEGTTEEAKPLTTPLGATITLDVKTGQGEQLITSQEQVELRFDYTPVQVDQHTAEATPMAFVVTDYQRR